MIRSLLHAAVARATGETLATVKRLGFHFNRRARPDKPTTDDPLAAIDCPCCGGSVVVAWNRREDLPEFADCRTCDIAVPYSPSEVYEISLDDVAVPTPRALAVAA